jgi:hypothetical protein
MLQTPCNSTFLSAAVVTFFCGLGETGILANYTIGASLFILYKIHNTTVQNTWHYTIASSTATSIPVAHISDKNTQLSATIRKHAYYPSPKICDVFTSWWSEIKQHVRLK